MKSGIGSIWALVRYTHGSCYFRSKQKKEWKHPIALGCSAPFSWPQNVLAACMRTTRIRHTRHSKPVRECKRESRYINHTPRIRSSIRAYESGRSGSRVWLVSRNISAWMTPCPIRAKLENEFAYMANHPFACLPSHFLHLVASI